MSNLELAVLAGVHRRTIGVIVFIGGLYLRYVGVYRLLSGFGDLKKIITSK